MLVFFLNFDFAFEFDSNSSVRQLFSAFLCFHWDFLIRLFFEISKWILLFYAYFFFLWAFYEFFFWFFLFFHSALSFEIFILLLFVVRLNECLWMRCVSSFSISLWESSYKHRKCVVNNCFVWSSDHWSFFSKLVLCF